MPVQVTDEPIGHHDADKVTRPATEIFGRGFAYREPVGREWQNGADSNAFKDRSMATLTPDELTQYKTRGYVVPSFRLSEQRVGVLQSALEELLERNPGIRPEQLISVHVQPPDGAPNAEGTRGVKAFLDLARDPDILDLVENAIGPDIVLWGCGMFCKPSSDGMEVPMHQDGHYWPIHPLATCTVWVAIEDSDKGNGCLRVVPGSHRNKALHPHSTETGHFALSERIAPEAYELDNVVDVELKAGQMSLHDVYMIHGSNPNTSTRRRTGIALRYMPASSYWDRGKLSPDASDLVVNYASRPLWLVRGTDTSGRNDFQVGHYN